MHQDWQYQHSLFIIKIANEQWGTQSWGYWSCWQVSGRYFWDIKRQINRRINRRIKRRINRRRRIRDPERSHKISDPLQKHDKITRVLLFHLQQQLRISKLYYLILSYQQLFDTNKTMATESTPTYNIDMRAQIVGKNNINPEILPRLTPY